MRNTNYRHDRHRATRDRIVRENAELHERHGREAAAMHARHRSERAELGHRQTQEVADGLDDWGSEGENQ
jgi:hypothetical protein